MSKITPTIGRIPLFNGENYHTLRAQMEGILHKGRHQNIVLGKEKRPAAAGDSQANWEDKDMDARSELLISMEPAIVALVRNYNTSKEIWDFLESSYDLKSTRQKAEEFRKFMNIRMSSTQTMDKFLREFDLIVKRLTELDAKLDDDLVAVLLLDSLDDHYKDVQAAFDAQKDFPSYQTERIRLMEVGDKRKDSTDSYAMRNAVQRLSKTNSRFEVDYQSSNALESTSSPTNDSVPKIIPLTTKVMRKHSIERDYSQTLQFQRKSPALDSGAGSSRSDSPHSSQQISSTNRVSSGLYNASSNLNDAPPLPPPRNSTPPTPPPAPSNLQLYKRRSPAAARSAVLPAQSPARGTSPVSANALRQPSLMIQTAPKSQQQKQTLNMYQTSGNCTEPPPPYHINTTVPQPPPIFTNSGGQSPTHTQSDYRKSPSSGIYSATSGGSPSPIAISANVIVPQNSAIHQQPWGAYQTRTQPPIIMQSVKSTQVQKPVLQTAIAPTTPATLPSAHVTQAPPSYASSVHQKTHQISSTLASNATIALKPQASQTTPPATPPIISNSNTIISSTEPPSYAITIQAIKAAQQQQTRQLPPPPPYQVLSSNNNHTSSKNNCISDVVNCNVNGNGETSNTSNQPTNINDNVIGHDSSDSSSSPSTVLSLSTIADESNELLLDKFKPHTGHIKTDRCTKIKHQSPIPERKKVSKEKEEERKEFRIRHYSPQAFKFFMEQHIENVIKSYKQRTFRKNQLEKEMIKIGLSTQAQIQMRRMLNQKESNYIRLKRAKMDKSMFVQIKHIGVGAFGEVSLVQKIDSTNHLYAMKTLRKTDVLKRNQVAHVKAERDILAEADNEWVVKLYYSFQDRDNLYFVMDYIPGGDLMSLLIKKGIFEEPLAKFYIAELTCAVESVHKMGFIHRDIKPDNILIDRDGHIKLTDFGLCTGFRWTHNSKYYQENDHIRQDSMEPWEILGEHDMKQTLLERRRIRDHQRVLAHSLVGTPNYIAPEVLERSGYTQLCDWWSVGVILYEMLVGQPPFLANTPVETQQKVINWEKTLNIPSQSRLSREASDLIRQLCSSADRRLGRRAEEVKAHMFFKGIDFADMRKQKAPYVPKIEHPTDTSNFDPIDPDKLRSSPAESNKSGDDFGDSGKPFHGFFEFTFRRFFDDKLNSDLTDDQSPVYV